MLYEWVGLGWQHFCVPKNVRIIHLSSTVPASSKYKHSATNNNVDTTGNYMLEVEARNMIVKVLTASIQSLELMGSGNG